MEAMILYTMRVVVVVVLAIKQFGSLWVKITIAQDDDYSMQTLSQNAKHTLA
jgi:hypothetical protein